MIVVLDTTETYSDLRLEGPNYKLLGTYLVRSSNRLVIPSIVFEETVNHFRERLAKSIKSAVTAIRDVERLLGIEQLVALPSVDVEGEVVKFRDVLSQQIKKLPGDVIGFAKVDVAGLVSRSLHRRKPFDGEGRKGFRDAVLWETVYREFIDNGAEPTTVALVTGNTSDFGRNDVLAEDLQEDCTRCGRSKDAVRLFSGLQSFIDQEVKPHLETLDRIHEELNEGRFGLFDPGEFFRDFHEVIVDYVKDRTRRCDWERLTRRLNRTLQEQKLRSLEKYPEEVSILDVWSLEDDLIAAGIDFTVKGMIQCEEEREDYDESPEGYYPYTFTEEYVGDATFGISMTVILRRADGDLVDFEVNDLEVTLGSRWAERDW